MAPRTIGNYEIGSLLNEGAMGVLYKGKDLKTGKPIAIKTLSPEQKADPRNATCLGIEYTLARKIQSPNVVRFLDFLEEDGTPYLIMELIEGVDLRVRLSVGRLPVGEGLEVAKGIAVALRAVHELDPKRPIVHADVKPENIMLRAGVGSLRKERVVLVDFGTALVSNAQHSAVGRALSRVREIFSGPQVVGGSSLYMSPEQATQKDVGIDPRADVYSLGAVMFEIFTGRPPFLSQADEKAFDDNGRRMLSTPGQLLHQHYSDELKLKHMTAPAPSPRRFNVDLPEVIEKIIMRCLEKQPKRRFQSSLELLTALTSLKVNLDGSVVATRRVDHQGPTEKRVCLLRVVSGPLKGSEYPLENYPVKAGRKIKPMEGIVLPAQDIQASGEHAVFQRNGDYVSVADLGSKNGVLVNGVKLGKAKLKDGDKVALGGTLIKVSFKSL